MTTTRTRRCCAPARAFRRLSELPGRPAVLVACHPVKNAHRDNLIPRGGSSFLNEIDGNLTIWRHDALATIHTQGKFRGPLFEPVTVEFETVTCDALKEASGRLIPTVVAKSVSPLRASDLQRETEHREQRALAIIKANPLVSVRGLADSLGCAASTAHAVLKKLKAEKRVKRRARKLMLADEGEEVLNG